MKFSTVLVLRATHTDHPRKFPNGRGLILLYTTIIFHDILCPCVFFVIFLFSIITIHYFFLLKKTIHYFLVSFFVKYLFCEWSAISFYSCELDLVLCMGDNTKEIYVYSRGIILVIFLSTNIL